jgi:Holliday junction resolvase
LASPPKSDKSLSVIHEDWIAKQFGGVRSKSSGAAAHDAGDVRVSDKDLLIECKMTRSVVLPVFMRDFEKITKEAWEEGKQPMLALRYYSSTSLLAVDKWIDVCLMQASTLADIYDNQT